MHFTNRLINSLVQVSSAPTSDSRETSIDTRFVSKNMLGLVDDIKETM